MKSTAVAVEVAGLSLLDEPANGLDPDGVREMRALVGQLAALTQGGTADLTAERAALTAFIYAVVAGAATLILLNRSDVTA